MPSHPKRATRQDPAPLGALVLALVLAAGLGGCDMHRWAYVRIRSTPAGASVRSKGLDGDHRLRSTKTPVGFFLPCTPTGEKARVLVPAAHWSYVLQKADHNDEELFVERSALAAYCADTQEQAKAKPFTLHGRLVPITTEAGLKNSVNISSDPPGVSVYDAGTKELIGKTPFRATFTFFAPYKVGRVLEFRLPGYQVLRRKVHVRSINLFVQMLRPGERPRPLAPPPKKARPRPAPPAGSPASPSSPARPTRPTRPAAPTPAP